MGTFAYAYIDPDLCRTGLVQRVELARSLKTISWRLTVFPRTGDLNRSKRVPKVIRDRQKARLANSRPHICGLVNLSRHDIYVNRDKRVVPTAPICCSLRSA